MNYLLPGTIVSVPFGPFHHLGIVSDRQGSRTPYIISCSRRAGQVAEETAHDFANGGDIKIHGYPSKLGPVQVIQRARSQLGSKYDLFNWNCEHFVHWAHGLKLESPQLQSVALISMLAISLFWLRQES